MRLDKVEDGELFLTLKAGLSSSNDCIHYSSRSHYFDGNSKKSRATGDRPFSIAACTHAQLHQRIQAH